MDTNTISLIISLIAVISSVVGWFVVHSLSRKRDFENKKKEIRISYLINAWQLLESASNRDKDFSRYENIEKAIADIQLFGTQSQIEIAQQIADEFKTTLSADTLDLLIELRRDLRCELGLERVKDTFRFIRFNVPNSKIHR
jgi:hypothetical protein